MFGMIPFDRNEHSLFNYLDEMERSFWNGSISDAMQFRCDVQDRGDHYLMEAELPGFESKDIKIDLDGDKLTISAQRDENEEKKDENGYLFRERKFGSFSRSFDVSGIDTDKVHASCKNGVLELVLPKRSARLPGARRIEIADQ